MQKFFISLLLSILACQAVFAQSQQVNTEAEKEIEQADQALEQNNIDSALALYRHVIKVDPSNSTAHERLGNTFYILNDLSEAESELRKALNLDSNNANAHCNLGLVLAKQQNYSESAFQEKLAIDLDPENEFAWRTFGSALASLGYYDQAINAFQHALKLKPINFHAYVNLAATLGRKGDYANAALAYKYALKMNPHSAFAHIGLGAALGKTGDLKGQIDEYKIAIQLAPEDASAHGRLGWTYYQTGKWQKALEEGTKANWIRFQSHGMEYIQSMVTSWAFVFLLFGLIFAVLFLGSKFKPDAGEDIVKSYFLTFHNDKPGRFIITNKRILFIPETFSRWFGAKNISIDKPQIESIESNTLGGGGMLTLILKDATSYQFRLPKLILRPLLEALGKD